MYNKNTMMLNCQMGGCPNKEFAYECGMSFCTKKQLICQSFLIENSIIKSITKTRYRHSHSLANEHINECSSDTINLNLRNICIKSLNCSESKFLASINFLLVFQKPNICACNSANNYDCNGEFCTKNEEECINLLTLNDKRNFLFNKIAKCH